MSPSQYYTSGDIELHNSINDFPTTNQPVLDTTISFKRNTGSSTELYTVWHSYIGASVQNRNSWSGWVTHIESKMSDITISVNDLVDAHSDKEEEMGGIKAKLADLEDGSRRNKVKIRGVLETIQPAALKDYFVQPMATFIPDTPTSYLSTLLTGYQNQHIFLKLIPQDSSHPFLLRLKSS